VIYRPGLLGRGEKARWNERLISHIVSAIPVETVAKTMVAYAEHCLDEEAEEREGGPPPNEVWENAEIYAAFKTVTKESSK